MQRLFLASCATFRDALTLGLGGSSPTTVPAPPAWPMLPACLPSATRFPPSVCQMSHLFQTVVSVLRTLSILELLLHLLLSSVRAYCCLKDVTTAKIRSGSARAACSVQWLGLDAWSSWTIYTTVPRSSLQYKQAREQSIEPIHLLLALDDFRSILLCPPYIWYTKNCSRK